MYGSLLFLGLVFTRDRYVVRVSVALGILRAVCRTGMSACVLSVIFEFFVPILVCAGADGWNTCRASRWGACMSAEIIREGGMGGAFFVSGKS